LFDFILHYFISILLPFFPLYSVHPSLNLNNASCHANALFCFPSNLALSLENAVATHCCVISAFALMNWFPLEGALHLFSSPWPQLHASFAAQIVADVRIVLIWCSALSPLDYHQNDSAIPA